MRNGLLLVALLGLTACAPPVIQDKDVLDYINSCHALGFDATVEVTLVRNDRQTSIRCFQIKTFTHPYR